MVTKKNIRLKDKKEIVEIKRQFLHLILGCLIAFLFYVDIITSFDILFLLVISILFFFVYKIEKLKVIKFFMKHFEREGTIHEGIGFILFLTGIFLSMFFFAGIDKNIVTASILMLAIGDSTSHIIGKYLGFTKVRFLSNNKNIEGTIVSIVLTSLIISFFVNIISAFLVTSIVLLIEYSDFKKDKIDDNLIIPVLSCILFIILKIIF